MTEPYDLITTNMRLNDRAQGAASPVPYAAELEKSELEQRLTCRESESAPDEQLEELDETDDYDEDDRVLGIEKIPRKPKQSKLSQKPRSPFQRKEGKR
ncbi:MAG TPA: hypothetical protein VGB77_12825 [Abditibacteriaceae bacterium]|jgi:hypothetical protein